MVFVLHAGGSTGIDRLRRGKLRQQFRSYERQHLCGQQRGAKRGANLITLCEIGGLRICHLGDLGHQPDAAQLRALGRVDVLMIPVGGTYTLDGEGAARAVRAIAPRTIVPMHFKVPHLLLDIAAPDAFLRAMGPYTEVGSELELSAAPAGVVLMLPAR